ncbi:PepSY-associated TM helix domain-containing protein [Iningainema tapete]|uniref:PepSY domain-containing protein n=1 Tax=Iningainema tapete BLCC-T55 TaxID=2748662 RepID=A0A8J7C9C9_9CYAN|nr:PepSY-associated TM helix domain-containing protein [Iningainema tapete]MBD2775786.1 PepSY domain-containing protein [Iningainema tapete BLCC-T55]
MKRHKLRHLAFYLHRYIGLAVGLLLVLIGLTGSLLVFADEIDHFLLNRQMGHIIPSGQRVSIESVLNTVKTAYSNQPELKLNVIRTLPEPDVPYQIFLASPTGARTEIHVNPYTGAIMGSRSGDYHPMALVLKLHYQFLAGETGQQIIGVVGLLFFILSITGIILWPGWRKLISGVRIKLKAHPKRKSFDIHKVAGITAGVFLAILSFTGLCFNFYNFTKPIIYAVTFTPNLPNPVSQPIVGKTPLLLRELLQKADAALPNAVTTYVVLPKKPTDALRVGKKLPQESWKFGFSQVYLDQYTGKVVQLKNGLMSSPGDKVLNSFIYLHFGIFGGLFTRVLYIFVGLAPTVLFVTGLIMWRYRRHTRGGTEGAMQEITHSRPY